MRILPEVDVTVQLDARMQAAVHQLLSAEPEPETLLPSAAIEPLGRLFRCDVWGVGEMDRTGYCLRETTVPHDDGGDPQVCDGPVPTGFQHDAAKHPDDRDAEYLGLQDILRLGFSTGSGGVRQVFFARSDSNFSELEVGLLRMLEPAMGRLLRSGAGVRTSESLTVTERQVLDVVARGCSNREVAEELFVTVHTVRKHLEHAYRKLGVTNRTAAALTVRSHA